MNSVRIGILGAAKIAPRAVIETARAHPRAEVTCVAARDPVRASAYAEKWEIPGVAESYEALVGREDVDLVYVALPAGMHAHWTIRALEAGKAVLCEKPFALDEAEARAMAGAATRAGRPLLEAFHYIHHPVMVRALELAAAGAIGRPIAGEAVFNVAIPYAESELRWRPELGGGALMDLGCYAVHALRRLAREEPLVTRSQMQMEHGVDASTHAELWFAAARIPGRIACSMTPSKFEAYLRIEGEDGWMEITNFIAPQIGCRFTLGRGETVETVPADPRPTFAFQLDHVIEVVADGAPARVGGADSIANMAAIDAVKAAARAA